MRDNPIEVFSVCVLSGLDLETSYELEQLSRAIVAEAWREAPEAQMDEAIDGLSDSDLKRLANDLARTERLDGSPCGCCLKARSGFLVKQGAPPPVVTGVGGSYLRAWTPELKARPAAEKLNLEQPRRMGFWRRVWRVLKWWAMQKAPDDKDNYG